jgi:hypothetical protein
MLAQAPVGMVNFSNNPTFIEKKSPRISTASFGKYEYHEVDTKNVKNIVSSSFEDPEPEFEKTVYINHIGIYDEDRNLIAIAKTANPVRKRTQDDFTFKLKLDF